MKLSQQTLNELVSSNFQYASVLDRFGIAFYEHPENTLQQVCNQKGLQINPILKSLELTQNIGNEEVKSLSKISAKMLVEYLRKAHALFMKDRLPYLNRLVQHLDFKTNPIAKDLQILVPLFAEDFINHIHEEEDTLFAYILQLNTVNHADCRWGDLYQMVEKYAIAHFADDHETHDDEMKGIRDITRGYILPDHAGLLWQVVYAELQVFEKELQFHAHVENHILFPKALVLEKLVKEKIARLSLLN
ncbi:MAG: iron-sulfur cluster repair di-iron protein [Verrucomicrobia bacterium]|nr:iron-sulfur cluster repair di-iron protein [Cytophagales bacterium]